MSTNAEQPRRRVTPSAAAILMLLAINIHLTVALKGNRDLVKTLNETVDLLIEAAELNKQSLTICLSERGLTKARYR